MTTTRVSKVGIARPISANTAPREALASPSEVAEYLGTSVPVLAKWRYHGRGPRFVTVGRSIRYRWSEVDAWLANNTRSQTG